MTPTPAPASTGELVTRLWLEVIQCQAQFLCGNFRDLLEQSEVRARWQRLFLHLAKSGFHADVAGVNL